jgi:hypothetical protein
MEWFYYTNAVHFNSKIRLMKRCADGVYRLGSFCINEYTLDIQ